MATPCALLLVLVLGSLAAIAVPEVRERALRKRLVLSINQHLKRCDLGKIAILSQKRNGVALWYFASRKRLVPSFGKPLSQHLSEALRWFEGGGRPNLALIKHLDREGKRALGLSPIFFGTEGAPASALLVIATYLRVNWEEGSYYYTESYSFKTVRGYRRWYLANKRKEKG